MNFQTRYVHPFISIFPPREQSRRARVAMPRDTVALMLVSDALQELQGYRLGNPLFNFPPDGARHRDAPLAAVDADARPGDLIVSGTRTGIGEEEQGYRRRMNRGYTTLEEAIIQVWERYLRISSRGHTMLRDPMVELLPEDRRDRADIFFYMSETAHYQKLGRRKVRGSRSTAAFVVRERELWEGGPGYLGFFGMSSETTMVLAHRLRKDHGQLLCDPAFVMLELSGPPIPRRPTDMSFADDWKAEVLIHHPL